MKKGIDDEDLLGSRSLSTGDCGERPIPLFTTRLFPVHHIILRELCALCPIKFLTLSQYCYDLTIPSLYHEMDLTLQLLLVVSGFGDGHKRMRAALSHTRVLHIHDHRVVRAIHTPEHNPLFPRDHQVQSLDGTFSGVKVLVLHELVLHASFYIDTRHPMRGFFQTLLSCQFSGNLEQVVGVLDPSDHPLAIEESIQELLCFAEALRAPVITLEGAAGSSILKALSVTSGKLPICWSGAKLLRIRIGPPLHSANGKMGRKSKADYDQKGRKGKTGTKGSFEHASARIAKQYARREWERCTAKTKVGELIEQVEFVVDNDYVQGWMKQGISAHNGLKVLFTFEA